MTNPDTPTTQPNEREDAGTFPMPPHGFTCFHCGETFTTPGSARNHFGFDPSSDPACRIKVGAERGLVMALRKAEEQLADAWSTIHTESTEAAKAYYAQNARHREQLLAVEEAGYEKGLADGRADAAIAHYTAHLESDAMVETVARALYSQWPKDKARWLKRARAVIAAQVAAMKGTGA